MENGGLPEGWALATVSDVTVPVPNYKPELEPERDFGYVDIGCVSNSTYSITGVKRFEGRDAPSRARRPIRAGDVLSSNVRTYLRNVVMVPEGLDAQLCSTGFTLLRPNVAVHPGYLFYHSLTDEFIDALTDLQTGSNYPAVTDSVVMAQPLPLAPLAEQRRIVNALDSLLERVSRTKERLARVPMTMKRFGQSVLAAACSGRLTADWREEHPDLEPASVLLDRIRAERKAALGTKHKEPDPVNTDDLPELPEGWKWAAIGAISTKVVDGVHRKPEYVSDGIPFLTIRNLTRGRGIDFSECSCVPPETHEECLRRAHPEQGDILISKDGTLGVTRLVRTDRPFSIFVSLALVKPALKEIGPYLALAMSSPQVQVQMVPEGSGLQHIHLDELRKDCLPLAPLPEQHEIVRRVEALFALADAIEKRVAAATARAEKITQSILARAFRGELVPTEAELARAEGREYEPAWVMLQRVRAGNVNTDGAKRRRGTQA